MVDKPAKFITGPTKGSKYKSKYLQDEENFLYQRKHKKTDSEFGRHLWICLTKGCSASASTQQKEGEEVTKIVAFGAKPHDHVADLAKVSTKTCSMDGVEDNSCHTGCGVSGHGRRPQPG